MNKWDRIRKEIAELATLESYREAGEDVEEEWEMAYRSLEEEIQQEETILTSNLKEAVLNCFVEFSVIRVIVFVNLQISTCKV